MLVSTHDTTQCQEKMACQTEPFYGHGKPWKKTTTCSLVSVFR